MTEPTLPPLRADLHAAVRDTGVVVTDPVTGRRTELGVQSAAVWAALCAGHRTPAALRAALPHLPAATVRGRLLQLAQGWLFAEGALEAALAAVAAEREAEDPGASPEDRSAGAGGRPRVDPQLRHRCVGCGSSCVGVLVAPVGAATVAALTAHPLPGVAQPVVAAGGGVVALARATEGCVALTPAARCALHATSGAEAKPDPCRLFPYYLMRTPRGLRAGLGAECRSLPAALLAGQAEAAGREGDLGEDIAAELTALGDYAAHLSDPAPVGPGVVWSAARLESAADTWLAAEDPLAAAVAAVAAALAVDAAPARPWLDWAHWPGAAPPERAEAARALLLALAEAAAATAEDASGRQEVFAAERAILVGKAAQALAGEVALPPTRLDADAAPVLAAAARGSLAGLEFVARRDAAWGLGRLRLQLALAQTLARVRAAQVARVAVRSQDVVDGLVAASMFLRSPRGEQVLGLHAASVRGAWLEPERLAEPWRDAFGAPV